MRISDLAAADREVGLQLGLTHFIRMAWPIVEPGRKYYPNWHIDVVAEHLEAVYKGQIRRLIINQPPGTMKSLAVSVFWPTWVWLRDPGFRWIYASYDSGLSIRDARRQLSILRSPWFTERWGDLVTLPTVAAEGDFQTLQGGFRYSTFINGPVTGRHADCQICDDPIKPKGLTRLALDGCIDWWTGTMPSRMSDPKTGRRVIIMQRLHDDDLSGFCARTGDYEILRLPMRYEPKAVSYTRIGSGDLRSDDGELLWPERLPESAVSTLEREMGPQVSAAQLQQRPVPEGGNIFQRSWFRHWKPVDLPARFDQLIQSWDLAFKGAATSDYVVGQVWGRSGSGYYLLDCVRKKANFPETLTMIRDLSKKWPKCVTKLVEDKANGPAVISSLESELSGIVAVNPEGGKETRANAVTPLFAAGNVWHPDPGAAAWVADHEDELLRFPFGSYDDSVDACTQALTHLYGAQSGYWDALTKIGQAKRFSFT